MPNVNVTYTPLPEGYREDLHYRICHILAHELGCPANDVTVRFIDVPADHYSIGGWTLDYLRSKTDITAPAPIFQIDVSWFAGKPAELADRVAQRLVRAVETSAGISPNVIEVGFSEMHSGNYFIAGKRVDAPKR